MKNEALYKHLERRAVERSAAAAEQRRQDAGQWWWEHHLQKRAHEHQQQWQGAEPEEVEQLVAELDQHCELFRCGGYGQCMQATWLRLRAGAHAGCRRCCVSWGTLAGPFHRPIRTRLLCIVLAGRRSN